MNIKHYFSKKEQGSYLVLGAGTLVVLTGFAVAAIDIGRIYIVRNELQNVADAAALAGANCLDRRPLGGVSLTECEATKLTGGPLSWGIASAKAQSHLGRNMADNIAISTTDTGHQIEVGYYNLGDPVKGTPPGPSGGVFSTTFTPITTYDKPAVKVTVTKDAGKNGGPIAMLTNKMFGGGADVPMSATAVAVISSPGNVPKQSITPQVINKCMFDTYWNSATGQPVLFKSTDKDPFGIPQTVGQPWKIRIGSAYHYPNCIAGQWTSFEMPANADRLAEAIASGNNEPLNIGSKVNILKGTVNSGYKNLSDQYPTLPIDSTVIVVNIEKLTDGGQGEIYAFAGFRITRIEGGSDKYIEGQFIPNFITPGSSGIGPFYGTYTPPRLAF